MTKTPSSVEPVPVDMLTEAEREDLRREAKEATALGREVFGHLQPQPERIRRARTETFEHTISGLLTKRADLLGEAELLRDRMAEIKNDVAAIDRVLTGALGYDGDLDAQMPRQKRQVLFGRGELTRAILSELRDADRPLTSREIAQAIVALRGDDARDRKVMSDLVKRVSKALRALKQDCAVRASADSKGNRMWSL